MRDINGVDPGKPWENPAVTSIGRAPDHTAWGAYETAEQARTCDRTASAWVRSLNGDYTFRLCDAPEQAGDFFLPSHDESGCVPIKVPGSWQLQGFGKPIYTNIPYPWSPACEPPAPPRENPTGCYRRRFDVPEGFLSRDVFLRFEAVESAFLLWVNGAFVGYSEDSRLACEFDVTHLLHPGENLLAMQVMRFASSSWLEDQDNWSLSGIHRDVSLIAKPRLRIQDYQIAALPDVAAGAGAFSADVTLTRAPGFADCRVRVRLWDADGAAMLGEAEAGVRAVSAYSLADGPMANTARLSLSLASVTPWTPDAPRLYTAVFTLLGPDGRELDSEGCRFGFKRIALDGGIATLNGRRLVVCGVNRHEHGPQGRVISPERMREEIRQMKRMNINAVRTSHYPSSETWLDLCDELGLLVVCECNLETHGLEGRLSNDPGYAPAFLERAMRMARILKNHVSIYAWSLGNESGYGANHAAMYGFLREYDKTRLCQYESASPGPNISDIRGQMYATVEDIHRMLADPEDTRPVILVEYSFQICNSGGGVQMFRELVDAFPRFQGGFVWDWQDRALPCAAPDGRVFSGYGGDFGEDIVEDPPYMICSGILLPDLTWKPVAHALAMAYAPLRVERAERVDAWNVTPSEDTYVFINGSFATDGAAVEAVALLKQDGVVVRQQSFALPQALPGQRAAFELSVPHAKRPGSTYHLDIELRRKAPAWHQAAGEIVFAAQFPLSGGGPAIRAAEMVGEAAPVAVEQHGDMLRVVSGAYAASFALDRGELVSFSRGRGERLLWGGQPSFGRPRTGLDCREGWGWHAETSALRAANVALTSASTSVSPREVWVRFEYAVDAPHPLTARVAYRATADALTLEFTAIASGGHRALPRLGLCFAASEGLEALEYCGYGPVECYPDRMSAARLGVYKTTVEAQHFPFIPPSENGGHEGTRWLRLAGAHGGLRIEADSPFHFDAHHNTVDDYTNARHEHELVRRPETYIHLDAAHSPIGGAMAWSTNVVPHQMLGDDTYHQRFTLTAE